MLFQSLTCKPIKRYLQQKRDKINEKLEALAMEITFQTTVTPTKIEITLPHEHGKIHLLKDKPPLSENSFYLFFEQKQCIAIGKTVTPKKWDTLAFIQFPWDIESDLISYLLQEKAESAGLTIETDASSKETIPSALRKKLTEPLEEIVTILETFGYSLEKGVSQKKKKPAKARHRWSKKVSKIPFTVNYRNSQATLYWISRNELLIKAGATLLPEAPLNKNGSVSYSAKYGEKLRDDYKDRIADNKTTKDIIVKSVNEASLLLYFGGTNSWLEIVDENGKSIDEWTKVD